MVRLFFLICFLSSGLLSWAQGKAKKAVFVIVDGVPHDVMETLDLPNFRAIAKKGGFAKTLVGGEKDGYSQTPTISAVGYNSVLTGTWVNKHNVWDNDIEAPNYRYPNIFRLLKEQAPQKKIGIFSSWLDNRTKLVGEGKKEAGSVVFDYRFDGLELDTVSFPHDKARAYMHAIDERVADTAAHIIRTHGPDLSWVYLEYTDDMGHLHGDSPEFYKAVAYADAQVGRIWQAIQHRQQHFDEDWLLIVTTDHGRDAKTGKGHGGQSDRERAGWIVTNAKGLNSYFKKGQSSLVDIMPTIARFMNMTLPDSVAREVDGVPLTRTLSLTNPTVLYANGRATFRWTAHEPKGKVKIWMAQTNHFKSGAADAYRLIAEVPVQAQQAVVDLKNMPSPFYKFVLEGRYNRVNVWLLSSKEKQRD